MISKVVGNMNHLFLNKTDNTHLSENLKEREHVSQQ